MGVADCETPITKYAYLRFRSNAIVRFRSTLLPLVYDPTLSPRRWSLDNVTLAPVPLQKKKKEKRKVKKRGERHRSWNNPVNVADRNSSLRREPASRTRGVRVTLGFSGSDFQPKMPTSCSSVRGIRTNHGSLVGIRGAAHKEDRRLMERSSEPEHDVEARGVEEGVAGEGGGGRSRRRVARLIRRTTKDIPAAGPI